MYRILTDEEWMAISEAEAVIYADEQGIHPYTDVRDADTSQALAAMWDDAKSSVEMFVMGGPTLTKIVAERVARAQYYLMIGELPTSEESYETRKFKGMLKGEGS